jgi:hypothetical protein
MEGFYRTYTIVHQMPISGYLIGFSYEKSAGRHWAVSIKKLAYAFARYFEAYYIVSILIKP